MFSAMRFTTFYVDLDVYLVLEYFNLLETVIHFPSASIIDSFLRRGNVNLPGLHLSLVNYVTTFAVNVDAELQWEKPEKNILSYVCFSICMMERKTARK